MDADATLPSEPDLCGATMDHGLEGGDGAPSLVCPLVVAEPPCVGACGNGAVDTCEVACPVTVFWPPCVHRESCDGADHGQQTCQSLGFASGSLGCLSTCEFDTSRCERCVPGETSIRYCGTAAVDALDPSSIALDATDDEVGLAWLSRDTRGARAVHFARFSPSLELIQQADPFLVSCDDVQDVHLASRPGGWLVVLGSVMGLQIVALDSAGHPVGDRVVSGDRVSVVFLSGRPGGRPLLGWLSSNDPHLEGGPFGVHVAPVESCGAWEGTSSTRLPWDAQGIVSAVFSGGGWLVARTVESQARGSDLQITRINLDGSPGQTQVLPGAQFPILAADGGDTRLAYVALGKSTFSETQFQHLTSQGEPVGEVTSLGPLGDDNTYGPLVALGARTLAVVPIRAAGAPRTLRYVVVNSKGALVDVPKAVATDPTSIGWDIKAARRGPEVVLAWTNGNNYAHNVSIGMARIDP